jgi:hypothetical protein
MKPNWIKEAGYFWEKRGHLTDLFALPGKKR